MNLLDRLALRGHIRGRLTALQNLPTTGESQTNGELKMPTRKPTIGSISTGTLRQPDLIEAFADELAAIDLGEDASALVERANAWLTAQEDAEAAGYEPEYCDAAHMDEANELILALTDALNERAPPYCVFACHEGDGADFGFWPDEMAISDLPYISDPGDPRPDEDHSFTNDHGNVTVYAPDGTVLLELV